MNAIIYLVITIFFVSCEQKEVPVLPCKNIDKSTNTCMDGSNVMSQVQPTPTHQGMSSEQLIQILSVLQGKSSQPPPVASPTDTVEQFALKTEEYWLSMKNKLLQERSNASPERRQQIDQELQAVESHLTYHRRMKQDPPSNWGHNANQACQAVSGGSCLEGGIKLFNTLVSLGNKEEASGYAQPIGPPIAPCASPPC